MKKLTPEQLENAARMLCKLRGYNPPVWKEFVHEVERFVELQEIVNLARLGGTAEDIG